MIERYLFAAIVVLVMTIVSVLLAKNCGQGAEGAWCREYPGYTSYSRQKPCCEGDGAL